jgi:carbonic anhydrase/acetyltransferase-like protein (isoleucine patch superfamily)
MNSQTSQNLDPHVISADAQIIRGGNGTIFIDQGCIIHPKAKIIAEGDCSIFIGKYNIIEENVIIRATPKFNPQSNLKENINLMIGNFNIFKVGSEIENATIHHHNFFDYRCKIEENTIEPKCIITPGVKLPRKITIKSGAIIIDDSTTMPNYNFNEEENVAKVKAVYILLAPVLLKGKTVQLINNMLVSGGQ